MAASQTSAADWWRGAVIYQVYPRSFQDTTGDGVGDLKGIKQRLGHIASLGVDAEFAGVASAMVNTSQQVGGSIGTALLNTLAATATSNYLAAHLPPTPHVQVNAALAGYNTGYWAGAAFFVGGAIIAALLFRRRGDGLTVGQQAPADATAENEPAES